jgi:hypothetical protein
MAERDLAAYRRRGPSGTARRLLRMLEDERISADTLLDIGAGIGVLHHELLSGRIRSAVHVEAARAYLEAAKGEAQRRGQLTRVSFLHGDFLSLVSQIEPADVVTLDRVLCCYPELDPLLQASVDKARRYWAASFPRDRWYVRLHTRWQNFLRRRAGNPFRTFVHPVSRIHALVCRTGLRPLRISQGPVWVTALYGREEVEQNH